MIPPLSNMFKICYSLPLLGFLVSTKWFSLNYEVDTRYFRYLYAHVQVYYQLIFNLDLGLL